MLNGWQINAREAAAPGDAATESTTKISQMLSLSFLLSIFVTQFTLPLPSNSLTHGNSITIA
ncbi:hypothetical protein [Chitinilyticum aquatile]|uniref:hypothetical protein n=1 Tax=Chitinilyticum aquatile TaxID=362520 RepID=UPI00048F0713|nr:hypothetical protein [Chitinilyticum aquatile]